MRKFVSSYLFSVALSMFIVSGVASAVEYKVDAKKSSLGWLGKKVVGDTHNGTIQIKSGMINFKDNKVTAGNFVIDMTTIKNLDLKSPKWNKKLVDHLNSDDFFSVGKHKEAKLVFKKAQLVKGKMYQVFGDLTIKGKTHPVKFTADVEMKDKMLTAKAKVTFDRTMYDVRYGSGKFFDNLGDKMIADEVELDVNLVAMKSASKS